MNNKGIGVVFCLISAILISAKYLSAAIFMSGGNTWDATLFAAGLSLEKLYTIFLEKHILTC